MSRHTLIWVAVILLPLCPAQSTHAETLTWNSPAGGTWNTASNWNPADVPNETGEVALIADDASTYTITVNISPALDAVSILNPEVTLNLGTQTITLLDAAGLFNTGIIQANSGSCTIDGPIFNQPEGDILTFNNMNLSLTGPVVTNDGTITINPTGGTGSTNLNFLNDISLEGTGEIHMITGGQVNDAELETGTGYILTQQAGHTIRGAGSIRAEFINNGTVTADETGHTLYLSLNPKTNNGTIGASAGCYLNVSAITVAQGQDGILIGDEGTVRLDSGATIVGGTITSESGGVVQTVTGVTFLEDVQNTGLFHILPSCTVNLQGAQLDNDGVFIINPLGSSSNGLLRFSENVLLSGNGEIQMVAATSNNDSEISSATDVTGTNGSGHTIRGAGNISAALINEGLISADDPVRSLLLNEQPKTNRGTFQGINGGQLMISGCAITQDPGAVILADNGQVGLDYSTEISGGELQTANSGEFYVSAGTVALTDLTNYGYYGIRGGAATRLGGTQVTNNGTIVINSNASSTNAILRADSNVMLDGNGTVRMYSVGNLNDAEILSAGDGTITIGSDQEIRGSGSVSASIINEGLISADDAVYGLKLFTQSKINRGELRAESGGRLWIYSNEINQENDGRIVADNGMVELGYATINGGSFSSTNGGVVRCHSGSSSLTNVANEATLQITSTNTLNIHGVSFTNDGLIDINHSNLTGNAILRFNETAEMTGTGEVLLHTNSPDIDDAVISTTGSAVVTIGPNQLIHGDGGIRARMINQGTIIADYPAREIGCASDSLVNRGTMRAENGGDLEVASGKLINESTITAIDTSRVVVAGGVLTNRNELTISDESTLLLRYSGAGLVNEGLITVGDGGYYSQIDGASVNRATVQAMAQGSIAIDGGTYKSEGLTKVLSGGSFWSDRMIASAQYSGGTFSKGTWQVESGGTMRLINCNVQTLKAGVVLIGADATIYSDEATTDALTGLHTIGSGGHLEVRSGRNFDTAGDLTNDFGALTVGESCLFTVHGQYSVTGNGWIDQGVTHVDGNFGSEAGMFAMQGGILSGSGTVSDTVYSSGWVKPGVSIGTLTLMADYFQTGDGFLDVKLGGTDPGESDQLVIGGLAQLSGTLVVQSIDGYTPQAGDRYTVLTCGSRTGQFDVTTGAPGYGLTYETFYYDDRVEIEVVSDLSFVPDPDDVNGGENPDDIEGDVPAQPIDAIPTTVRLSARPVSGSEAVIRLALPKPAEVELRIFDLSGRQVDILAQSEATAGVHEYIWHGRSASGQRLSSGIYLVSGRICSEDGVRRCSARIPMIR